MPVYSGLRGGAGSGGGVPNFVLVAGSPFANVAALEAWASANPTLLFNDASEISTAFVDGSLYQYRGVTGSYVIGQWSDETPDGLTPDMIRDINSIGSLTAGSVPMATSEGLMNSIVRQPSMSEVRVDGELGTTKSTILIGDALTISEDGAAARLNDPIDNIQALPTGTLLNADGTTSVNVAIRRDGLASRQLLGVDTETRTGDWVAHVPVLPPSRVIQSFRLRFAQAATGLRFTLRQATDDSDITGAILYQSHTNSEWESGEGLSVTASPEGGPDTFEIPLDNSAKVLEGSLVYVVVEQNSTGTGDIELRGLTTTIGGINQFYAFLEETYVVETRDELALKSDDQHPVTLRRDMPSLVDAQAIADASLNQNSALWLVANNQLSSSNRADATFQALQAGFLDLNGNEIPTTPTAANTIPLRGGTTVRIFSGNQYRIVNSPVFETDITTNSDVVNSADLSISGQELTVTLGRNVGADLTDTITLPDTGTSPVNPQPRFTRFAFQTQPTSVAPATTISGLKTFLINIDRPDLITGHLTISQDGSVLTSNVILPTVRSASVPITTTTLTNAGDTTTFTIEATSTEGAVIREHITIRAYQIHDLAYWDIRPTNDFATIDVTTLNSVDITTNDNFDVTGDFINEAFIGILVPNTHDVRQITTFNLPATTSFTRDDTARTISGVPYILYTLQNNGGVDGSAAYNVEV